MQPVASGCGGLRLGQCMPTGPVLALLERTRTGTISVVFVSVVFASVRSSSVSVRLSGRLWDRGDKRGTHLYRWPCWPCPLLLPA